MILTSEQGLHILIGTDKLGPSQVQFKFNQSEH